MKYKNISRRSFIIGAGLGVAGIVTGIFPSGKALSNIKSFDNENNAFSIEPNIWLEIKKDNTIVITIPRSELGQGVRTSFSMIAAEELDADWDKIKAINAPGDKKYGNQSTGGSTSIRTFWEPLRVAGAQARLMMIAAAAKIWQVSKDKCKTDKSFVYEIGGNRSISYADLIETASKMPIPAYFGERLPPISVKGCHLFR
jgi:isoquinoline 1-oxidoreductase beta subunit